MSQPKLYRNYINGRWIERPLELVVRANTASGKLEAIAELKAVHGDRLAGVTVDGYVRNRPEDGAIYRAVLSA